jgi:anaerobic selenocysteine-containing dehydrogenase
MDVLRDPEKIGLHVALTPTWSETAWFADYVLPMGVGAERHDLQSQETQAGKWIGFRQPVLRVAREKLGQEITYTHQSNPGEVWEEDEFWTELSWRVDADGALGIRQHFESPYRPGEKISTEEYYRWIFENSIPGLKEKAASQNLTPWEYMRKYGAFQVESDVYRLHEKALNEKELYDTQIDGATGIIRRETTAGLKEAVGVLIDGVAVQGFPTPSRKLEFYSPTLAAWGWPEYSVPGYIKSHVHWENVDRKQREFVLIPTFRLPTLIHTRSGNAKWLNEISHSNPIWMHPRDARSLRVNSGELLRITTDIGYFVNRVYITESIRPGIIACSHHLGRWRLKSDQGTDRWASALVEIEESGDEQAGTLRLRHIEGVQPFKSADPDSERIWWSDAGVHQNLTFPVHPDPISGMHCWHQKVRVELAAPGDRYGDVFVDKKKSMDIYREWLAKTRPAPGPGGLRRPLWLSRTVKPHPSAYLIK